MIDVLAIKRRLPQFGAALSATVLAFAGGCVLGWSSPSSSELTKNNTETSYPFKLTDEEFSWVGSSINLGAMAACIPCGLLLDWIGRKWTLLLLIVPGLVGWGFILGAQNLGMMITGRVFLGMFAGPVFVVTPLYITEIAEKEIRGILGTFMQLLLTMGILFVYAVGVGLPVFWLSLVCAVFPIIFGLIFINMPETSTYLVLKNQIDKAERSIKWFRGKDYDPQPDILQIQDAERERQLLNQNRSLRTSFSRPESQRALMLVLGLMLFQQFSGINAVIFYTTDIFKAANTDIPAEMQTIIVGVIQVVMTFVSTLLVDKLGRKPLLMLSDFVMAVCCIALGAYFFVSADNVDSVASLGWLPILSLSLFMIAYSIGFGPLPFVVLSELCAEDIKGVAMGSALTLNWTVSFLVTKFFSNMVAGLGIGPTFWVFSCFSLLGTSFIIFLLPETKGIELWEIQVKLGAKPTAQQTIRSEKI